MRPKQLPFKGFAKLGVKKFGGSLLKGNPREARPIAIKRPMHLVMRSSLASGRLSFLRPERSRQIKHLVYHQAKLKNVKIRRYANSGNHLHIMLQVKSRASYRAYVRALSGLIARKTLGAERGSAKGKKFWDARPFTRILEWGREYRAVSRYLLQNILEAHGLIPYQPRRPAPG